MTYQRSLYDEYKYDNRSVLELRDNIGSAKGIDSHKLAAICMLLCDRIEKLEDRINECELADNDG